MARPRTPVAKAKAIGADVKNPGRHKARSAPKNIGELGPPSAHLGPFAKKAFELFRRELPWLKESHRVLVELASRYRGQMLDPEVLVFPLGNAQELRRCLAQLGATPADESKVNTAGGDEEDPDEALFRGAQAAAPPPPPKPKQH